jgi:hypothetical protein
VTPQPPSPPAATVPVERTFFVNDMPLWNPASSGKRDPAGNHGHGVIHGLGTNGFVGVKLPADFPPSRYEVWALVATQNRMQIPTAAVVSPAREELVSPVLTPRPIAAQTHHLSPGDLLKVVAKDWGLDVYGVKLKPAE